MDKLLATAYQMIGEFFTKYPEQTEKSSEENLAFIKTLPKVEKLRYESAAWYIGKNAKEIRERASKN